MIDFYFLYKKNKRAVLRINKKLFFTITIPCKYEVEQICIGRSFFHREFIFIANKYFRTYSEFENFYYKNKRRLTIISDYEEKSLSFGDLLEMINFNYSYKKNKYKDSQIYSDDFGYIFKKETIN